MIKRTLLALIALASTAAAAYTLCLLDQIVHGTLYNYGLQFSYNWANPYWTLLRITQVLLTICIITTIASLTFTLRTHLRTEKQHARAAPSPRMTRKIPAAIRNAEKPRPLSAAPPPLPQPTTTFPRQRTPQTPTPEPTPATPSSSHTRPDANGFTACPNCGKSFSQPLRMLDFQGERPRIVDTCPFCGETIPHAARAEERKQDQDNRFPAVKGNRNGQKTITQ